MAKYRISSERIEIIRSILAERPIKSLNDFSLTEKEEYFFRKKARQLEKTASSITSPFTKYCALNRSKPFLPIGLTVAAIFIICLALAVALILNFHLSDQHTYPLAAAAATILAIAMATIGWGVGGWVSHRNATVQHTINLLFARLLQSTFAENISRFNKHFSNNHEPKITIEEISRLDKSLEKDDRDAAQTVKYILNYYEFISAGIARGDLDLRIISSTVKSQLCFYYDKCFPYIAALREQNHEILEHYSNLRNHYKGF